MAFIEVAAKPIRREVIGKRIHAFWVRVAIGQQAAQNNVGRDSITKVSNSPHSNKLADVYRDNRTTGHCRNSSTVARVLDKDIKGHDRS
jgi:hypothetical protein